MLEAFSSSLSFCGPYWFPVNRTTNWTVITSAKPVDSRSEILSAIALIESQSIYGSWKARDLSIRVDFVERINFVVVLLLTGPDSTGGRRTSLIVSESEPQKTGSRVREKEIGRRKESAMRAGGGYKPKTIAGARLLAPRVSMPYTP